MIKLPYSLVPMVAIQGVDCSRVPPLTDNMPQHSVVAQHSAVVQHSVVAAGRQASY